MRKRRSPLNEDQRRLAEAHIRCAYLFADQRCLRGIDPHTRLSAAMDGLMWAALSYDPSHPSGASFETLAMRSMWSSLRRERLKDRLIHVPETFWNPGHPGMSDRDYESARRTMRLWPIWNKEGEAWDVIDPASEPEIDPYEGERARLHAAIDSLPTRHRIVLRARLRGLTLRAIATGLGVSRNRVHQYESEARTRLRKQLSMTA